MATPPKTREHRTGRSAPHGKRHGCQGPVAATIGRRQPPEFPGHCLKLHRARNKSSSAPGQGGWKPKSLEVDAPDINRQRSVISTRLVITGNEIRFASRTGPVAVNAIPTALSRALRFHRRNRSVTVPRFHNRIVSEDHFDNIIQTRHRYEVARLDPMPTKLGRRPRMRPVIDVHIISKKHGVDVTLIPAIVMEAA